ARVTNEGIASAVARHPERLVGMGVVPLQAPELAVLEMRRCVRELGLRGIEISSHVGGRELAEERFRPFFAAAQEMGVLLFLHPLGFTHGERLRRHYLNNLLGNPIDSTIAIAHLIFEGVLDRLPGLKLCIAHGGGYAAAYWGRLDHAWRARPDCRARISNPPSHYLRKLHFDTLVFDAAQLQFLLQTYGPDHLCLGTDYPFDMPSRTLWDFTQRFAMPIARRSVVALPHGCCMSDLCASSRPWAMRCHRAGIRSCQHDLRR